MREEEGGRRKERGPYAKDPGRPANTRTHVGPGGPARRSTNMQTYLGPGVPYALVVFVVSLAPVVGFIPPTKNNGKGGRF